MSKNAVGASRHQRTEGAVRPDRVDVDVVGVVVGYDHEVTGVIEGQRLRICVHDAAAGIRGTSIYNASVRAGYRRGDEWIGHGSFRKELWFI